jgi:hypothetical protein
MISQTIKSYFVCILSGILLFLPAVSHTLQARGYRSSTGYWVNGGVKRSGGWYNYYPYREHYGWPSYYAYYGVPIQYTYPYYSSYYYHPFYYKNYTYSTHPQSSYYQSNTPGYPIPKKGGVGVFYSNP